MTLSLIDFDIDIDVPSTFNPLEVFGTDVVVKASTYKDKKLTPHPCGVYFQNVPKDPLTNLSAITYKEATDLGCFKVDFLHLYVYDHFSSKDEIKQLIKIDPDWNLLEIPSVVKQLFQISNHFDIVNQVKPKSILELADCLALIRPQKRYALNAYLKNRIKIRNEELYKFNEGDGGYGFKKAHSIAYSCVIILQLHLIKGGIKL